MTTRKQEIDFSVDLMRAILWQYNDAVNLQSLLGSKDGWYAASQSAFWTDWINDVFNLKTANAFGLSVWGIILNIPLSYGVEGSGNRVVFGFGAFASNFENSNFGRDTEGVVGLSLEQQRFVLRLRYYQLISDGTVPHINFMLQDVFGGGYVLDSLDMTATYIFPNSLNSAVIAVLEAYDLLPRPAGVEINILINPADVYGFAPYYLNFENGTFGRTPT